MNNHFQHLDKAFDNKVRLVIMSILMVETEASFNDLKNGLKLTDGNLASHLKALEKIEYVEVFKSFLGRKPNTQYKATKAGRSAFKKHINALEKILDSMK